MEKFGTPQSGAGRISSCRKAFIWGQGTHACSRHTEKKKIFYKAEERLKKMKTHLFSMAGIFLSL